MTFINKILGVPLGYVMWLCYRILGNYGLSILLFTLISKVILLPLSILVQKNSIRMIRLQPEVNRIRLRFAGDRDKIAEEQMALYKREHYSPMLSIIPLLVQLPLVLGLVCVIYNPMQHLLHIDGATIAEIARRFGMNVNQSGYQCFIMEKIQCGTDMELLNGIAGIDEVIRRVRSVDMTFLGLELRRVPTLWAYTAAGSKYINPLMLLPVLSCLTTYLLCLAQNKANVLQVEQSFLAKWGVSLFTIALSTYFTFLVPAGAGVYWIAGNLFAIGNLYLMNWWYNPKKYIDYEALEETKELLARQNAAREAKKQELAPFREQEKRDYKRFVKNADIEPKQIVFYSEGSGFYKYYDGIIQALERKDPQLVIHYVTSDPKDAVFSRKDPHLVPYYIGELRLIPLMMKMDADMVVMTMPDLDNMHIRRSYLRKNIEYLYVPHGMDSLNMTMRKGSMDHFDSVLCVGPHQKEEIEKTEAAYGLPKKRLIEWGYGLLDQMRADYAAAPKKASDKKVILVAPSWQEGNIVDSCVTELIDGLRATGSRVILRPHPQQVRHDPKKMEELKAHYAADADVEIQTDFSSNNTVFEADLLVTDWSGIAYEYAYTTCKPVLFINTPMKVMNPEYQKIDTVPLNILLREEIGRSLQPDQMADVARTAQELLGADYHDKIAAFVATYVYHLGTSSDVAADYILSRLAVLKKQREEEDLD